MNAHTDEFVVAVCMNLWFWFHSIQLFPNIKQKIHLQYEAWKRCVSILHVVSENWRIEDMLDTSTL